MIWRNLQYPGNRDDTLCKHVLTQSNDALLLQMYHSDIYTCHSQLITAKGEVMGQGESQFVQVLVCQNMWCVLEKISNTISCTHEYLIESTVWNYSLFSLTRRKLCENMQKLITQKCLPETLVNEQLMLMLRMLPRNNLWKCPVAQSDLIKRWPLCMLRDRLQTIG